MQIFVKKDFGIDDILYETKEETQELFHKDFTR